MKRIKWIGAAGFVLFMIVLYWAIGQKQDRDAELAAAADAQWGSAFGSLCNTAWPERLAPIPPTSKVAFWAPQYVGTSNFAIRQTGLSPQLLAHSKIDLTHVVCVKFVPKVVASCSYEGGTRIDRRRIDAAVTLVDVKNKSIVARWGSEGPAPRDCPATIRRQGNGPADVTPIDGLEPDFVTGVHSHVAKP